MSTFHLKPSDYIYNNLSAYTGNQQQVHQYYKTMANDLELALYDGPEKSVAMRKLLESFDAAIRSVS